MRKVGIYCPSWTLGSYNTDQRIIKSFARIQDFIEVETQFVANSAHTLAFNFNRLVERVTGYSLPMYHGLKKEEDNDVICHYGNPVSEGNFFKSVGSTPVFVTTGFMTDHYVKDLFGVLLDRKKEADELARSVDKAAMIHFHTEGGRQRFLAYRPEFEEKTVSVPFFLPDIITSCDFEKNNKGDDRDIIKVLFIGRDGKRKGLHDLVEALDLLGSAYLKTHRVEVTIVSKDKPNSKSNIHITWHKKLPHNQVIRLMQEASIFVLVPSQESYGLVMVEAMMSKCAIITDDDETRHEILNGTGMHVPFGSSDDIAKSLRRLIEDEKFRVNLGEMAKHRAERFFHPNVVAHQYKDCFQSILTHPNLI